MFLQVFATGIPAGATVSAQIGVVANLIPLYAGPAPGVPGVQQVNVMVPNGAQMPFTGLTICVTDGGQQYCSSGLGSGSAVGQSNKSGTAGEPVVPDRFTYKP